MAKQPLQWHKTPQSPAHQLALGIPGATPENGKEGQGILPLRQEEIQAENGRVKGEMTTTGETTTGEGAKETIGQERPITSTKGYHPTTLGTETTMIQEAGTINRADRAKTAGQTTRAATTSRTATETGGNKTRKGKSRTRMTGDSP
jgi:hypothetical protein